MSDEELNVLAEDIKKHGLIRPIVLNDERILDGRNRYKACKIAGVEPRFVKWSGNDSALEWVMPTNLVRRHLTASQRAVIAADLLPMLEKEAKERQRLSKGRGVKGRETFSNPNRNGKASELAARIAGSNPKYVETVKRIAAKAPELIRKIRSGILGVQDAGKLASLSAGERKQVLNQLDSKPISRNELRGHIKTAQHKTRQKAADEFAKNSKPGKGQDILIGDMKMLWKKLDDDSVDLFLTDPPYGEVDTYERLAELAAAKLKPSGLCLAYSGHFHLPSIIDLMRQHLEWWWMLAIRFTGDHCAIHARKIQSKWKPIIVFGKPPLKPAPESMSDMLQGGGRDKEYHEWGQDESEASYLIRHLTEAGDLVVDPYCGGGTIPAACKALGRKWLATEIDRTAALLARKRVSEVK